MWTIQVSGFEEAGFVTGRNRNLNSRASSSRKTWEFWPLSLSAWPMPQFDLHMTPCLIEESPRALLLLIGAGEQVSSYPFHFAVCF